MTTTLQSHGGGAQPASIDTSGKVTGGTALRVYGFDTPEAARAAGYVCEGGPAMSVALITDAQIASGAWKAEGDPSATIIYTAPSSMPVEGGYAVPIYAVNGWGSTPAPSDPIGDTLRADAVAYWTMGEASGTRIDATLRGNDLTNNGVSTIAGHIGNASTFAGAENLTDANNSDLRIASEMTLAGWAYIPTVPSQGDIPMLLTKAGDNNGDEYYLYAETDDGTNLFFAWNVQDEIGQSISAVSDAVPAAKWLFLVAEIDIQNHRVRLYANNALGVLSEVAITNITASTQASFRIGSYGNGFYLTGRLEQWGKWNRVLSSTERDYLYNSSTGRALFPAP